MPEMQKTRDRKVADDWEQRFAELQRFQKRRGHCRVPLSWPEHRPLAQWTLLQREQQGRLPLDPLRRLYDLGFPFGRLERHWLGRFFELVDYQRKQGHCNVSPAQKGCAELGQWVQLQRYNRKGMALHRLRRLTGLGFEWDAHAALWNERFRELQAFKAKHGHCSVPTDWPENRRLGFWVATQRSRKALVPPERRRRLSQSGFVWNPFEDLWERGFAELKAFYEQRESRPWSRGEVHRVVSWASLQRRHKRRLSVRQIRRLDSIGFDWAPFENQWNKNFQALVAYQKRFGHCLVPLKWKENPALGVWVNTLRSQRARKRFLTRERLRQLNAIHFDWDFRRVAPRAATGRRTKRVTYQEALWNRRFSELQAFHARHGHCSVPSTWPDQKLAVWVVHQRQFRPRLSPERRRRLEQLGFVWSPFDAMWDERLANLAAFKKKFGHCNVSSRDEENPPLAAWVQRQRNSERRSLLSPEHWRRLNALGFDWNPRRGVIRRPVSAS